MAAGARGGGGSPVSVLRVVIADDEAMVRAGLRLLIEGEPDLEVVGEATDGEAAVAQVAALAPDVVLMDVRMPRLNGLEAARRVVESGSPARVVVLTTFDEDEVVDLAIRHGVAGFLLKSSPPEDLVDAIRRAGAGHGSLDPAVVPGIIERYRQGARAISRAPELDQLTAREREVLALVGRGYSNAEIAARLFLGETTVKTHLGRVLDKLGLRDRPRAIAFAYESGLIRAGSDQDGP